MFWAAPKVKNGPKKKFVKETIINETLNIYYFFTTLKCVNIYSFFTDIRSGHNQYSADTRILIKNKYNAGHNQH